MKSFISRFFGSPRAVVLVRLLHRAGVGIPAYAPPDARLDLSDTLHSDGVDHASHISRCRAHQQQMAFGFRTAFPCARPLPRVSPASAACLVSASGDRGISVVASSPTATTPQCQLPICRYKRRRRTRLTAEGPGCRSIQALLLAMPSLRRASAARTAEFHRCGSSRLHRGCRCEQLHRTQRPACQLASARSA